MTAKKQDVAQLEAKLDELTRGLNQLCARLGEHQTKNEGLLEGLTDFFAEISARSGELISVCQGEKTTGKEPARIHTLFVDAAERLKSPILKRICGRRGASTTITSISIAPAANSALFAPGVQAFLHASEDLIEFRFSEGERSIWVKTTSTLFRGWTLA